MLQHVDTEILHSTLEQLELGEIPAASELPLDVWDYIAHNLRQAHTQQRGNFTMAFGDIQSLSLTCRHFRSIFQPVLFFAISLGREAQAVDRLQKIEALTELISTTPSIKRRLRRVILRGQLGTAVGNGEGPCPKTYQLLQSLPDLEILVMNSFRVSPALMLMAYDLCALDTLELHDINFESHLGDWPAPTPLPRLRTFVLKMRRNYYRTMPWSQLGALVFSPILKYLEVWVSHEGLYASINALADTRYPGPYPNLKRIKMMEPHPQLSNNLLQFTLRCPNLESVKFYTPIFPYTTEAPLPVQVNQSDFARLQTFTGSSRMARILLPGRPVRVADVKFGKDLHLPVTKQFASSTLRKGKHIRSLVLRHVAWSDDALALIAEALPRLTELTLDIRSGSYLTWLEKGFAEALSHLPKLRELDLRMTGDSTLSEDFDIVDEQLQTSLTKTLESNTALRVVNIFPLRRRERIIGGQWNVVDELDPS